MLNENFVIAGVIITFAGGVSYFIDTVKGKAKPNRVTWFLWSLAPLIAFFAEISQKVGLSSLFTLSTGLVPLFIFFASFLNKKSEWKLGKFDFICGAFSLLAIILWYITKVGNIAITFSIFADFMAAFPTVIKSFFYPETESYFVYLASIFAGIITLLTIKNWTFEQFGFPLYITLMSLLLTLLITSKIGKRISSK